jgi:hypothetical protein
MRVAGVRLQAPAARLLSQVIAGEGYPDTAGRIGEAIEQGITTEAPLTGADYAVILEVLNRTCPPMLYNLRRNLLEDQRYIRRVTGG